VTTPSAARRLVAEHLPGHPLDPVVPLGEGMDNAAFDVAGLVVRIAKHPGAARPEQEAAVLRAVARVSPVPVPVRRFTVPDLGVTAYDRLPGTPLIHLDARRRSPAARAIGDVLGRLLAALHRLPGEAFDVAVDVDDAPPAAWLAETPGFYAAARHVLPPEARTAVEAFLRTPPPPPSPCIRFSHNDLGAEHVLVDPGTLAVTGVIDWGDAAFTDPAYDVGLLLRDVGPDAVDAALAHLPDADPALRGRAAFHARCSLLEDLAYGVTTGSDAHRDQALAAAPRVFGF
jgi:aminoglycoside phosphotransferase (APT) family kinase protein